MPKSNIKHIAIAGNIGAGKTTLTNMLARHYKWTPHFEDVDHNPYLVDFYEDMHRWSFNLQIFFLNSRIRQLIGIRKGNETVIQDRTIYEDAHIFAPNLYEMGLMTARDFENYTSFFSTLKNLVSPPDLLIYLKASIPKLVDNIQNRGREYEENIRLDYLKRLNEFYNKWIDKYMDGPLLIVEVDNLDFANKDEDFAEVVRRIDAQIHGLF
ncbi:MAG: deoxynucleoside kinase [Bacteroidetes bacterium]|nr:deoxynucleoside kinase [Bacteroidota bacterium]MBS1740622.1 deoxynucleoside kinase [Bacteroidota bacterium]